MPFNLLMRATSNTYGTRAVCRVLAAYLVGSVGRVIHADDTNELKQQLELFRSQEEQLQQQLGQEVIEKLSRRVPPGTYQLKTWHERMLSQKQEVAVPENGEVMVDFTLGIKGLPKY